MPFFQTKIRHSKLTWSPFSAEQMMNIGQAGLTHIIDRIQSVRDITDGAAKPLNENYAEQKRKGRFVALGGNRRYSGLPVRDWTLRGRTLQSLKVKFASEDHVQVGPIAQEAYMIMVARNRLDHMWPTSPTDEQAIYDKIRDELIVKPPIQATEVVTLSA